MKKLAIIGPTASGKSDLALRIAKEHNAIIISIDSLAIYKEFDIVSAKPTKKEREQIPHFGIDEMEPNESFNVEKFLEIYQKAKSYAKRNDKNIVVVGGTSFYLKTLFTGISPLPKVDRETVEMVRKELNDITRAYETLQKIDPIYANKITSRDRYRIEKGLLIYYSSSLSPTQYFHQFPPIQIESMPIYNIAVTRENLRQRIQQRTQKMIESGLIDEIASLEKRYGRGIQPMKAIGVTETLDFLDGKIRSKEMLAHMISIHTAQLAKRQQTFNKTQFKKIVSLPLPQLEEMLQRELAD